MSFNIADQDYEQIDINDIRFDPTNPNEMTDLQQKSLEYSFKKWGYVDPIIIDQHNMVANGEHRVKILKDRGDLTVDVLRFHFKDDSERKLFRQTMNKLHGNHNIQKDAEEIFALIKDQQTAILSNLIAQPENDLIYFVEKNNEFANMLFTKDRESEEDTISNKLKEIDALPEDTTRQPTTKAGDLWKLGNHYLMCGDCTNNTQVTRLFNNVNADILLTDPPYSSGGYQETGKKVGSIGNRQNSIIRRDNLSTRGYINLIYFTLETVPSIDAVYIFTDWKMWINTFDTVEKSGFTVRNMIVWDKVHMGMGLPWRNQHELILFGKKTPAKMLDGKTGNVIQCKRESNKHHPTVKPIQLLTKLLGNTDGEVVYDPFLGSGSTLIACEQTGHKCYGMEIDQFYCDVIIERWQQYTGQLAELVSK